MIKEGSALSSTAHSQCETDTASPLASSGGAGSHMDHIRGEKSTQIL